jgi:hypothetical protein
MALSERSVVDRIEVLEMGQIQVRTATVILRDGAEISRQFMRHVFEPGDDTSGEAQRVQDIATATWTAQVITDWEAFVASRETY